MELGHQIRKLGITASRHREDIVDRQSFLLGQRLEGIHVIEAEQPAIGDHDDALEREAAEQAPKHGSQGARLGDVTLEDLVGNRQPLGRLHHPEGELTVHAVYVLAVPVPTQVIGELTLTMDPNGRQIPEDHAELLVQKRLELCCDGRLNPPSVAHQRIHGAQQLLMVQLIGVYSGAAHVLLEPVEDAALASRRSKAVEDHGADQRLGVEPALGRAKRPAQGFIQAELLPELMQRPEIAEGAGALELRRIISA